tara:strand:- start:254 stop:481 length:228 start_codon:yes stop_codon:yes gene_type:complete
MKTVFKVFGLCEGEFLTSAQLFSSGIETERVEGVTFREHLGDFGSEIEAIKFLEDVEALKHEFQHGFEIVKTFQF